MILSQNTDYRNSEAFFFFWYNDQRIVISLVHKTGPNYLVNVDEHYFYDLLGLGYSTFLGYL